MAMAMPPSDMMFAFTPCWCITMNDASTPSGSDTIDDQRRAHVQQEQQRTRADDDELLEQLVAQVLDGALDELRTVVRRDHFDAFRAGCLQLFQLA
jgi:hypothetical protein